MGVDDGPPRKALLLEGVSIFTNGRRPCSLVENPDDLLREIFRILVRS
jgi:hypothetical protein